MKLVTHAELLVQPVGTISQEYVSAPDAADPQFYLLEPFEPFVFIERHPDPVRHAFHARPLLPDTRTTFVRGIAPSRVEQVTVEWPRCIHADDLEPGQARSYVVWEDATSWR